MVDAELLKDLSDLLDKYQIKHAVLIFPRDGGEDMGVLTVDTSHELLRQIAHLILSNVPDNRGPLN